MHTTQDGRGGFHQILSLNDQGLGGVGLVSVTDYQLIRRSNTVTQQTNGAEVFHFVRNHRLIAKGSEPDYRTFANVRSLRACC